MPKTFYVNETDIPADQKGCYESKNGRWELTNLDNEHPVVVTKKSLESDNATLKTSNSTLSGKVTNLEAEKTELAGKALPHGHRAVAKDVAELGEAAKAAGYTKEELPTVKTKLTELETKEAGRADKEIKSRALAAVGIKDVDGFFELKASDALKIETETVDGKEKFYVVTDTNGVKEKKAFDADYLKNTDGFKNSFESLTKEKTGFSFSEQGGKPPATDIFAKIRQDAAEAQKVPAPDINARFGKVA